MREKYFEWVREGRFIHIQHQFGIQNPKGLFRTDGSIIFSSPEMLESKGPKEFTEHQLQAFQANPYLTLLESKPAPNGMFTAKFAFPRSEDVTTLASISFAHATTEAQALLRKKASLSASEYEDKAIQLAARLYWQLISIHPAWDGTGRTSKLIRDWLLLRLGVPPPAYTTAKDLELTPEQIAVELKDAIAETRKLTRDGNLNVNNNDVDFYRRILKDPFAKEEGLKF